MSTNIVIDNSQGGIESGGADVTLPVNPAEGGTLVASSASSYVTHLAAHTMRNRLINGAHMVSQRNGDRLIEPLEGVSSTLPTYTTDRWIATENTAVGRSVYFDGSGDYLSVPASSAYNFGTGDFTIEFWFNSNDVSSATQRGFLQTSDTAGGFKTTYTTGMHINQGTDRNGNPLSGTIGANILGTRIGSTTAVISAGTWYHCALTRSSGVVRLFLNGALLDSATIAGDISGTNLVVGGYYSTSYVLNGWISNLRIVKGTALYTANFTPSTSPLLPVAGTSLLACASKDIRKDKSSNDFVLTANGNAAISGTSPYGEGFSNYFDGTGDYLSIANNAALQFGSGDFTFECWFYISGNSQALGEVTRNACLYSLNPSGVHGSGNDNAASIQIEGSSTTTGTGIRFYSYSGGAFQIDETRTVSISQSTWHHLAISRSGTTVRIFLNGSQQGASFTSNADINFSGPQLIGQLGYTGINRYLNGYISNLRILKGTALYTANFTPPTSPLAAVSGAGYSTSLLTCASRRFEDKSANNFTITPAGNAGVFTFNPFTNVQHGGTFLAGRSAGWSNYFDGSGDYLTAGSTDAVAFDFGTGDFTVEAWVNYSALTVQRIITYANQTGPVAGTSVAWKLESAGASNTDLQFNFFNGSTSYNVTATGFTAQIGSWFHVAITRQSGTMNIFVNGIIRGTTSANISINAPAGRTLRIGGYGLITSDFNGYLSNLRILKGTALYTTNFTPSTAPLVAVPNTSLLTCASENFEDKSSNNFAITKNGDVTVRTMSPFSHMPTGFSRALQWSVTKPATATAGEHVQIQQRVEGSNIYDLAWGTAGAKAVTLSFWVRSPVVGTYCVAVQNSARDRSYIGEYTISAANTWEKKSVTIPGPTSGTWNTNTSEGLRVVWDLGSGTDFSGAAGSWLSANDTRTANQTNFVGTALASGVQSNDFMVTGAQFELGSAATAFEFRHSNAEVSLCQRYYARLLSFSGNNYVGFGSGFAQWDGAGARVFIKYPATMRSVPFINQSNTCLYDTAARAVTTIGEQAFGIDTAAVYLVAAGLTINRAVIWCGNNNSSAYVELNAEL